MRAAFVLVLIAAAAAAAGAAAAAAEEAVVPREATPSRQAVPSRLQPTGDRSEKGWAVAPQEALDRTPKRIAAPVTVAKKADSDELRLLGDIKVLELREEEALLRVDGVEQTIRAGMRLKDDIVKSVSPGRLVLVRPERVDEKRGETLIVVDLLSAGRSRVRAYAARDWTARPPRSTE